MVPSPNGVAGAAIAVLAIFLPSFLLLAAVLPLWGSVRERAAVQAAVAGIGAAVVGMLGAALWDPVLQTSVDGDVVAIVVVGLLRVLPAWAVVVLAAARAGFSSEPSSDGATATAGQLLARQSSSSDAGSGGCR